MALLLAAIGVYGSLSLAVTSRTREIGLRMALGCDAISVMSMVIGGALRLTFWGFALGIPLAVGAGTALRSLLFGISAYDGYAIGGACLVLTATAAVAALIPAEAGSADRTCQGAEVLLSGAQTSGSLQNHNSSSNLVCFKD